MKFADRANMLVAAPETFSWLPSRRRYTIDRYFQEHHHPASALTWRSSQSRQFASPSLFENILKRHGARQRDVQLV
eukprot:3142961-Pleurochrysis_carterae.AAC.4